MTWLLTGGAGYIGSHIVCALRATGRDVVVLDALSTGYPHRLPLAVPFDPGISSRPQGRGSGAASTPHHGCHPPRREEICQCLGRLASPAAEGETMSSARRVDPREASARSYSVPACP